MSSILRPHPRFRPGLALAASCGLAVLIVACASGSADRSGRPTEARPLPSAIWTPIPAATPSPTPAATASPAPGPIPEAAVPAESGALSRFLASRAYQDFAHTSEPAPSQGVHPTTVTAYFNATLDASLRAGNVEHPAGSAAIQEMWNVDGELTGWSVAVKTEADSDDGRGWYWFESQNLTGGGDPEFEGQGIGVCFGCHAGGRDFILTRWP